MTNFILVLVKEDRDIVAGKTEESLCYVQLPDGYPVITGIHTISSKVKDSKLTIWSPLNS